MLNCLDGREDSNYIDKQQTGNATMEDKQKVTLYLTSDLYRKLKIKAAVELETMSMIAARALETYIEHPELVAAVTNAKTGQHQVYDCPECHHPAVIKDGEMVALGRQPGIIEDDLVLVGQR
jgi:hypothetical protein